MRTFVSNTSLAALDLIDARASARLPPGRDFPLKNGLDMAADPIIYCLEKLTDYDQFERLCHDLMAREGYKGIEPLGGSQDKGRDAIHVSRDDQRTTIFAYSVREDWLKKLKEDAGKIKAHGHVCDRMAFLVTARITATERDKAVKLVREQFGLDLEIYSLERLRVLLVSNLSLLPHHAQIFTPSLVQGLSTSLAPTFVYTGDVPDQRAGLPTPTSIPLSRRVPTMSGKPMGLKSGQFHAFVCLQIDIVGHSQLTDPERVLHAAKSRFHDQVKGIVTTYRGLPFKWEGDGGAFLFPVTDGKEYEKAVFAACSILESLPSLSEELRLDIGLSQQLAARVSLDAGQAVYDANPGLITADFLNAFLKHERAVGRAGTVAITERVHRQISAALRGRFTGPENSVELGCAIYRANFA